MDVSQTTPSFKILMFPWLAHGHIFPFLELSTRLLSRKNFHIYLCSTPVNFPSIKNFIQSHNLEDSIEPVELHLEPLTCQLPPHYHTTKNLPSNLIPTLFKDFMTAKSSFSYILTNLNPDLVIYDNFQPWAARLASSHGIQAVHFVIIGAVTRAYTYHHYIAQNGVFPFPELRLTEHEKKGLDDIMEFWYSTVFEKDKDLFFMSMKLSSEVVLMKTSRAFEGKYLDYVSGVCNKKLLPVGPLVTVSSPRDENDESSEILQWLSRKVRHSTVYVSFGSECFLSKEEIDEISKGLELSEVNFIWVIRFPLEENTITLKEALPKGFLEGVQDKGIVVNGWAPQAKILAHPSIGAFVSHCGWSSSMESMYFGVPVIGMPIKLNMYIDANMLVAAGVCLRVPTEEYEGYKGEGIAEAIRKAIVGKVGDRLRCRAREFSEKMRITEEEEFDTVAERLWLICTRNKLVK